LLALLPLTSVNKDYSERPARFPRRCQRLDAYCLDARVQDRKAAQIHGLCSARRYLVLIAKVPCRQALHGTHGKYGYRRGPIKPKGLLMQIKAAP
jgi:hypothetical protein